MMNYEILNLSFQNSELRIQNPKFRTQNSEFLMVFLEQRSLLDTDEYYCLVPLNLYDSSLFDGLATQVAAGRQLQVLSSIPINNAIAVRLCEDDYTAWLPLDQFSCLKPATIPYQPISLTRSDIETRLPAVIAFTQAAMKQPNYYLWGGTVGPNYDCSGLIPRDSYQQEAFTQTITGAELLPGDLIFFGTPKVDHVALYLGQNSYIHSSGKDIGRNGIGIDRLSEEGDEVSRTYYYKLRGYGRVISNYRPGEVKTR
jgi:hypothetical protein